MSPPKSERLPTPSIEGSSNTLGSVSLLSRVTRLDGGMQVTLTGDHWESRQSRFLFTSASLSYTEKLHAQVFLAQ